MAGVQIGALHVSLSADSAAFDQGMDKAGKKSKETADGVEKDADGMASSIKDAALDIAASLAAAFAVANMVERIKEQIDYADALADVAARSNQTAEALSAMDYALHFQDATLENYTDGLQKLSQNMVAASEGSKEQAAIFEAMHIQLRDEDKQLRDTGDVILEFADQLASMSNGATKTQLAMDILGKSAGPTLLPFLNQGKAGIEEFTKKAKEMGLVVSTDFSNAAGQLNDNLDNLAYSATGAWRVIASDLTPALVDLSTAMLNITERSDGSSNALGTGLAGALRIAGGLAIALGGAFEVIGDKIARVVALGVTGLKAAFENPFGEQTNWKQFNAILDDTTNADRMTASVNDTQLALFGFSKAERDAIEWTNKLNSVFADLDADTQKLATLAFEERKKQLLEENALKEKNSANAQKIIEKQIADVASLRTSLMTDIQAEEAQYKLKSDLLNNANAKAFQSTNEQHQLLQKLKKEHLDKMLVLEQEARTAHDKFQYGGLKNAELEYENIVVAENSSNNVYSAKQDLDKAQEDKNFDSMTTDLVDTTYEDTIKKNSLKLDMHKDFISSFLTLDKERIDGSITNGDAELEAKKKQMSQTVSFFGQGLAQMAQGQGKAAKAAQAIQKAQALYEIGVNTYRAAVGAYAALSPIPFVGPALGVAAAAAAIAFGGSMAQGVLSGGGAATVGGAPAGLPASSFPTSQAEQRETEKQNQTTYIRIPEDSILTGRKMLDFIDEALGDGKAFTNLRFIPA